MSATADTKQEHAMHDPVERLEEKAEGSEGASQDHEEAGAKVHDELAMSKDEEKRILRKIDLNIIPYCSLLYLLSFLDRVNIGQAAVAGLKVDLGIVKGNAYDIALSVFVRIDGGDRWCNWLTFSLSRPARSSSPTSCLKFPACCSSASSSRTDSFPSSWSPGDSS